METLADILKALIGIAAMLLGVCLALGVGAIVIVVFAYVAPVVIIGGIALFIIIGICHGLGTELKKRL